MKLDSLKHSIQRTRFGRKLLRSIVLTVRALSASHFIHRLMTSKRVRLILLKSRLINSLITSHTNLTSNVLKKIEDHALRKRDKPLLYKLSQIYRIQRQYDKAFNILFNLLLSEKNELKIIRYTIRGIQAERMVNNKKLMHLFEAGELSLPIIAKYMMQCEYTLHSDNITPDWDEIADLLERNFDYPLANLFILAALGHQKIIYIDKIRDILMSTNYESNEAAFSRSVIMIAAAYYRSGEKNKLRQLNNSFSFDSTSWKIYMSFGQGKILKAMNYRGETIKNTFLRFYPYPMKSKKQILTPEKDICGEAFNPLFYQELHKSIGDFTVICDKRLYKILQRTFPYINFIPKTPRYVQKTNTKNFDRVSNYNLRDFLDNESFRQSKGANFFTIDYTALYDLEGTKVGRSNGWFKIDDEIKNYWTNEFGSNKKLIGISANSTLRSRIRDMHMIDIEHWSEIFNIPNCKFINLNASLSESDIKDYSETFNIEFINPKIDLFNDFDNLLAIMSILDFAIVPANNLMDFSSSVGINTIVFSPSNIMKTWARMDDAYVFSDKVKFIFPRCENNKIYEMVEQGANHIKNKLNYT